MVTRINGLSYKFVILCICMVIWWQRQHIGKFGASDCWPVLTRRIKFKVDTNPPPGSGIEIKYVDFPFVSSVTVQDKPSLFAGKIHALLCREYIKGRDWYDFLWYTSQGVEINYQFLASALRQQGPWQGQSIQVDLDWWRTKSEIRLHQSTGRLQRKMFEDL